MAEEEGGCGQAQALRTVVEEGGVKFCWEGVEGGEEVGE